MWSWRAQIISSSSCQLLQHLPQCLAQHWFPIESICFWEPTEGYINRMFSTFPSQAGKPTQKRPNCSVIWHSWVSQAGMRVINYKRHAVLPQRLGAYVTQSISYQTQSSSCYLLLGMSEQWILWGREQVRGSVTVGLHAEETESMKGNQGSLNRGRSLQVRQLEKFQFLPPIALSKQWGGAKQIQSEKDVQGTRESPRGENTENVKIWAQEVSKPVGEREAGTGEKRDHTKALSIFTWPQ